MKNFENFEAFKMSKTQMNEITGGAEVYCTTFNGEKEATFENTSVEDAKQELSKRAPTIPLYDENHSTTHRYIM